MKVSIRLYHDGSFTWLRLETRRWVKDFWRKPCKVCGKRRPLGIAAQFEGKVERQPDWCLGWMPGVENACCGHGCVEDAYVTFHGFAKTFEIGADREPREGLILKGHDALDWMAEHRRGPKP